MVVVDFVKMPPGEMPVGVLQQNKNVDKPDAVDQPDPGASVRPRAPLAHC